MRELEGLPEIIDKLEVLIESLQAEVNEADFFNKDKEFTQKKLNQLAESESKLEVAFSRWEELDEL